jgi:hypothetical protein
MHLTAETALDFLEGRLDDGQKTVWNQHMEVCAYCTEYLGEWQELRVALRQSHLKSPSDQDLERAFGIFPHETDESGEELRCVVASVIFDSFLEPALAGARGVLSDARQLVLHSEEFDIHVQLWGERNHWQMLGQMLSRSHEHSPEAARFHLLRNGKRLETTTADDLGEFHFNDVPEGHLSLQVDLPNLTVIGVLNTKEIQ